MKDIVIQMSEEEYKDIHNLTNNEKCVVMRSGLMCLQTSKKMLTETTEKEIYSQIESEFSNKLDEIEKMNKKIESDLLIERGVNERMKKEESEKIEEQVDLIVRHKLQIYDKMTTEKNNDIIRITEMLHMKESELANAKEQMRTYGVTFDARLVKEVDTRMKLERTEHDKMMSEVLTKNNSLLETAIKSSSVKTSTEIGAIGEQKFYDIAKKTFMDFEKFDIIDVHNQPHKGDFHITIKDVGIMIDAKAYKRNVDSSQIEKIKSDLRRNTHLNFAWLVSLNTNIDKKDHAVFLFEWISEEQCVIHINNLLSLDNKEHILKTVFYLCRDHYKRISDGKIGHSELMAIRDNHMKVAERVNHLKKRIKEVKTSLNGLKNLHDELEKDVINILNEESNGIVNKYYSSVIEWWSKHIKPKKGGKVKSTALWLAFKKENDELCKELDVAGFKNILCVIVPQDNLIKAKGKAGAMDILEIEMCEQSVPELKIDTDVIE